MLGRGIILKIFIALIILLASPSYSFADTTFNNNTDMQDAAISNGGVYTLTKDASPYNFPNGLVLNGDLVINVDAGVVINLVDQTFYVYKGTINYNGTVDDPIIINGSNTTATHQITALSSDMHPVANFKNVKVNNCLYGIMARNQSTVTIDSVSVDNSVGGYALYIDGGAHVSVKNFTSTTSNSYPNYIFIHIGIQPSISIDNTLDVSITNTDFVQDEKHKIYIINQMVDDIDPSTVSIKLNNNTFSGNVENKIPIIIDYNSPNLQIDATNNYWGTTQGPYVTGETPTNGPQIPSNLSYNPFKTISLNAVVAKACCSSVIFLPGVEGSRLYNKRNNGTEDQLWEPNAILDIVDLYGDENGQTKNGIYTRDIIEETNIFFNLQSIRQNIYKKISTDLTSLKNSGIIKDYVPIPYDWRESVDDIVTNGIKFENTTLYLIPEIQRLAGQSDTGKLTIVTHSNGGLLAKMLIHELESQGKDGLIDKVVMVSAPQIGTPDATNALLHGMDFDNSFGHIATPAKTRQLSKNIEMTYALLPSKKYYDTSSHPVFFDASLLSDQNLIPSYGANIDNYYEMKDFILATVDGRPIPDIDETTSIGIGNELLYNKAEMVHAILDNYNFPDSIKLYQVSGAGRATNKALLYKNRKVLSKNVFTPYNLKSLYGDGTVLNKSSNIMLGDNYYVDLYNYNKNNSTTFGHANIMELPDVGQFVNDVVQNQTPESNQYLSLNTPNYAGVKTISIAMHSPVYIHLYDSMSRHTGPILIKDQDGNDVMLVEENIPNSNYELVGETAVITVTGNEEYTLKLDGYEDGNFTLDINQYIDDNLIFETSFIDLPASRELSSEIKIQSGVDVSQIILDTNNDNIQDIKANKDGSVIDLNKKELLKPVESNQPVTNTNGGVIPIMFLSTNQPPAQIVKPVALESKVLVIEPVVKQNKIATNSPSVKRKTVGVVTKNNATIKELVKPAMNNVVVNSKNTDINNLQLASVGSTNLGKNFNLLEFIRKVFKKKK